MDHAGTLVRHRLTVGRLGAVDAFAGEYQVVGQSTTALAVCFGRWDEEQPVLVRIQSSCVYGEVLGARDCDCRDQLERAMDLMRDAGAGIIVYLDQEGRGAGLLAKARGYELSERTGVDSFAAYERLGLAADQRNYEAAAKILMDLKVSRLHLLTNNPDKLAAVVGAGLDVDRQPLTTTARRESRDYLASKKARGHFL